jgi:hypothetical protein
MRRLWTILLMVVALMAIAVIGVGISLFLSFDFNDGYAGWAAAGMVIEYMEANNGRWPPNWEALRGSFEAGRGDLAHVGGTFEQFQKRIYIDFRANPEELRKLSLASADAQFDVIHGGVQFGSGPNAVLRTYFRRKAGIVEAPCIVGTGGPASPRMKVIADDWYKRGAFVQFDENGDVIAAWTGVSDPLTHPLGDKELSDLRQFKHLKRLNVVGSRVTDAGLAYVKDIPMLEELNLGDTRVSDAGLAHLSGHPGLVELDLCGTDITDAGLRHLRTVRNLNSLRVGNTKISKDAIRKLRSQIPALEVEVW